MNTTDESKQERHGAKCDTEAYGKLGKYDLINLRPKKRGGKNKWF